MAMRGILRLGEVQIRVLDMAEAKRHYGKYMGLHEMMTDAEGKVYFKAWNEKDHHSVVLRETDRAGLDHFAYKVFDDATLTELQRKIEAFGIAVENVDAGVYPKSGRRIKFRVPTGQEMHLYAEKEYAGNTLGETNPGTLPDEGVIRGMRIDGLDHLFVLGPNMADTVRLFTEVFDFDLAEELVDEPGGNQILTFFSCSSRAHDIAFGMHPEPDRFHHASFRLSSTEDHVYAGDLMGKYGIPIEQNDRHGITGVKTIYFFDPSGNRNEIFVGGHTRYPDTPKLTWTMDHLGLAAFAQSLHVPETFLGVST
ncbi:catechol 2,3-dioxygenase [Nitrogeniibacter mangrovi]|uniref:Catechol 2,3-dioxygenase n=2 Tax=Nitrogeniibacter mangrovi TaxID=2016596 RepID=A0A6C1B1U4_9RHOO|nr:catechol 2,3-dioxygenase [Nitrogeniibacter mangrovi]